MSKTQAKCNDEKKKRGEKKKKKKKANKWDEDMHLVRHSEVSGKIPHCYFIFNWGMLKNLTHAQKKKL